MFMKMTRGWGWGAVYRAGGMMNYPLGYLEYFEKYFKKIARNVAKRLEGQQNSHSPGMCPFLSSAHQFLFTKISWIKYCEESFSMPLIHPWFLESRSNKYLKNLINIKGIHISNRSQNIHYFVNFQIWAPALISFLNHQQRQQTAPGCDFLSQLWLNDGLQKMRELPEWIFHPVFVCDHIWETFVIWENVAVCCLYLHGQLLQVSPAGRQWGGGEVDMNLGPT